MWGILRGLHYASNLEDEIPTLNFKGMAATWLQTVQRKGRITEWNQLCEMVMEKFDKNQHQILLKKFDALKQKDSVMEYRTAFEKIA